MTLCWKSLFHIYTSLLCLKLCDQQTSNRLKLLLFCLSVHMSCSPIQKNVQRMLLQQNFTWKYHFVKGQKLATNSQARMYKKLTNKV